MSFKGVRALIAMPYIVILSAFLIPLVIMIFSTFIYKGELSMHYYRHIYNNDIYFILIFRSVFWAFIESLFILIAAFPVAYFMATLKDGVFKRIIFIALTMQLLSLFFIKINAFSGIINNDGYLIQFFRYLLNDDIQIARTFLGVFILTVYAYLPIGIFMTYNALMAFDRLLGDYGLTSGLGYFSIIFKVIIPSVKGDLCNVLTLLFITLINEVAVQEIVKSKSSLIGSAIWLEAIKIGDIKMALALSLSSIFIALPIIVIIQWIGSKRFRLKIR